MQQDKERKKRNIRRIYVFVSMLIAFVSAVFLWHWNVSERWSEGYKGYVTLACVGILFCLLYWFFAKMYQAQKIGLYRLMELGYFQVLAFGMSDIVLFVASVLWFHGWENLHIVSYILVFVIQVILIGAVVFVCNRLWAKHDTPRKVLIIYGDREYKNFLKDLHRKKYRYDVVGCYPESVSIEEIRDVVDACHGIYLYNVDGQTKKEWVYYCHEVGTDIYITLKIDELLMRGFDISHTFDTPLIRTKRVPDRRYYAAVKRVCDVICSALALVVLSPVFLVVAIAIKKYDGGPILYKQIRLTKNHKEFQIYKFRSMVMDAEKDGARLASKDDDRITPIGKKIRKVRIDELPQLYNVLKGDMSLIGPRPERPEIEREYRETLPEFAYRLQVPAGLSGYAQIFGKYNTTPENKLKLDLLYINQRSLFLDFKLILYTIKILFIPESTEGVEEVTLYDGKAEGR